MTTHRRSGASILSSGWVYAPQRLRLDLSRPYLESKNNQ